MLQSIHDNAKGWVAYAIVLLISVPFALWGIQEYIGGSTKNIVAVVNGQDIELRAVQNEVNQQRQRITSMFGKLPPGFDEKTMRKSALENVINQTLLEQHANKHDYRASTREVYDLIKTIPQFQKDGVFDRETYRKIMASQGRSEASFEQQLRISLSNDQFRNAIADTAFLPETAMQHYQALSDQKRDIEVYTLKVEDVVKDITISDEMIQADYEKNPHLFQTDEFVKIAYVELNKKDISESVEVTDELLQAYYTENADRYTENATFKMSHIKVGITEQQNDEKAKAKADAIYSQITSGTKSFEEIVSTAGDETLFFESAESIGFLESGSQNPIMQIIEQAVFSANPGEVIKPVKTPVGYEIIKVIAVTPAKQKSFEQAKVEIEKEYRNEESSKLYEDLFDRLRTTSFENDGSLEPSASTVDAEIKTTEFFSRKGGSGTGLINNPNVISAAFSPEVLTQGINSAVIELSGSQAVVLRVASHKQPQLKPLADVRMVIEGRLKQELGTKQVKEKGKALLASVKTSGSWDALGETSTAVEKHTAIGRNESNVPAYIVQKSFQLTMPKSGKTQFSSVDSPAGDFSIIALTAINNGDGKVDEASASQFSSYIGNRVQLATLKALRAQAEIEIKLKQLEKDE